MKTVCITAKDNPAVKAAAKLLTSASARREAGAFLLEGVRLCEDALRCGLTVRELFVTEKARKTYPDEVGSLTAAAGTVYEIGDAISAKLSDTVSPQGVFAVCELPSQPTLSATKSGVWLGLECTQDPANLGAMARTAEALGVDGLLVSSDGCDPYSPKAQRAAMGSLIRLPVVRCDDFLGEVAERKANGTEIVAAVVYGETETLGANGFDKPTLLLIGNEGNGLSADAVKLSDRAVRIPMKGRAESFNAATAAALFLWEMMKGR